MLTILFAALTVMSCKQKEANKDAGGAEDEAGNAVTVTRALPVYQDFQQITNLGSMDIVFTPGDYSITVCGDSSIIDHVKAKFDSGTLSISMQTEANPDIKLASRNSGVKAYISCPELRIASVCNSGSFIVKGTLKGDEIFLGILGTGGIEIDSLVCRRVQYDCTGTGSANFDNILCDEAQITVLQDGCFRANVEASKAVYIMASSKSSSEIKAKTREIEIATDDSARGIFDVEADELRMQVRGNSEVSIRGTVSQKDIMCAGSAKLDNRLISN